MLPRGPWAKRFGRDRRYRLIEPIGGDPTSSLWTAEFLGQQVTLRLFAPVSDEAALSERARSSLGAVAWRLSHPHIAQVLTFGVYRRRAYVVMEAMEGQILEGRLAAGRVDPAEAASIAAQVAEALAAAHQNGVVHGGLHPGSIVLTTDTTVKVLDFGLPPGWPAAQGPSPSDPLSPDPSAYRAPELAADPPAPASDAYSVGALLFHLLTGHPPPVQGDSVVPLRRRPAAEASGDELEDAPPEVVRVSREALRDEGARPSCADIAARLRSGATAPGEHAGEPEEGLPSTDVPRAAARTPGGRSSVASAAARPVQAEGAPARAHREQADVVVHPSLTRSAPAGRMRGRAEGSGGRDAGLGLIATVAALSASVAGFVSRSARAAGPPLSSGLRRLGAAAVSLWRSLVPVLAATWRLLLRWGGWALHRLQAAAVAAWPRIVRAVERGRGAAVRWVSTARARRAERRSEARERPPQAEEAEAPTRPAEGHAPSRAPLGLVVVDVHGALDPEVVEALSDSPAVELLGHARSGSEAIEAIRRTKGRRGVTAVIGLDRPDDEGGCSLVRSIRETTPHVRIIVAAPATDAGAVSQAFFAGGDGFVATPLTLGGVVDALERTARGEVVLAGVPDD